MLVQQIEPQLLRPPVAVRPADAGDVVERALVSFSHNLSPFVVKTCSLSCFGNLYSASLFGESKTFEA
jgi:hypothetical protein